MQLPKMRRVQEKNPPKPGAQTKKKKTIFTKISHIYLQDKKLTKIPKHPPSRDLQVLYLYNNKITTIENLYFPNLTCLYLQNNAITKIENLEHLVSLKKLFIGHNKISVLEGMNNLEHLEELHIEKQDIPEGSNFCVDPRTILALSVSFAISSPSTAPLLLCFSRSTHFLKGQESFPTNIGYLSQQALFFGLSNTAKKLGDDQCISQ
ncbi:unnamed protein product [Acanthoscelides obtectus]|uniref:Uncharacterized protein n=1 Tax=Acanthoscelides obtectus TaxID=200917 RepID=A0A9P0M7R4_ACAOB|nr:unnamed protein product [Acanthoscelides obtectus]CAK1675717.1 Protein phosphatase 1 regulatory subunit 42 [Acanthoscelides obtectus]